jgi:hypothetical protein
VTLAPSTRRGHALEGVSRHDERLRFVARLLDGETMAALCAEFGISRKTGYKIYDRYKDCGVQGLTDRAAGGLPPRQQAPAGRRTVDRPVTCGAPTAKARSCSPTGVTAPVDGHRLREPVSGFL